MCQIFEPFPSFDFEILEDTKSQHNLKGHNIQLKVIFQDFSMSILFQFHFYFIVCKRQTFLPSSSEFATLFLFSPDDDDDATTIFLYFYLYSSAYYHFYLKHFRMNSSSVRMNRKANIMQNPPATKRILYKVQSHGSEKKIK